MTPDIQPFEAGTVGGEMQYGYLVKNERGQIINVSTARYTSSGHAEIGIAAFIRTMKQIIAAREME